MDFLPKGLKTTGHAGSVDDLPQELSGPVALRSREESVRRVLLDDRALDHIGTSAMMFDAEIVSA